MKGVLTLPLTVSTARVTGGRWSDFSSICQPITVMFPTRSLSADLQRAMPFGKWHRDWAPFLRKLSICHRGLGRARTWSAGQSGSTCCMPRLQGRQTGNPSPRRSASMPGGLRGGANACSPGLTLPQTATGHMWKPGLERTFFWDQTLPAPSRLSSNFDFPQG